MSENRNLLPSSPVYYFLRPGREREGQPLMMQMSHNKGMEMQMKLRRRRQNCFVISILPLDYILHEKCFKYLLPREEIMKIIVMNDNEVFPLVMETQFRSRQWMDIVFWLFVVVFTHFFCRELLLLFLLPSFFSLSFSFSVTFITLHTWLRMCVNLHEWITWRWRWKKKDVWWNREFGVKNSEHFVMKDSHLHQLVFVFINFFWQVLEVIFRL